MIKFSCRLWFWMFQLVRWYHIVDGMDMFLLTKKGDLEQALQGIKKNVDNPKMSHENVKKES